MIENGEVLVSVKIAESVRDWLDEFKYTAKRQRREKMTLSDVILFLIQHYEGKLSKSPDSTTSGGVFDKNLAGVNTNGTPALKVLLESYGNLAVDRLAWAVLQLEGSHHGAVARSQTFELPYPDPFQEDPNWGTGSEKVPEKSGGG